MWTQNWDKSQNRNMQNYEKNKELWIIDIIPRCKQNSDEKKFWIVRFHVAIARNILNCEIKKKKTSIQTKRNKQVHISVKIYFWISLNLQEDSCIAETDFECLMTDSWWNQNASAGPGLTDHTSSRSVHVLLKQGQALPKVLSAQCVWCPAELSTMCTNWIVMLWRATADAKSLRRL